MPTGSVLFSITGESGDSLTCNDTGGDTQPLNSGQALCDIAAGQLLAGDSPYTVSAVYSGDGLYQTSTGSTTQDVTKAIATVGVTSSASPLVTGQPVTFTATVTGVNAPGSGAPMGSIVFSVVGSGGTVATCDGGDTQLLMDQTRRARFQKGLPGSALTYTVSATLQDPNFKSPVPGTLTQQVNRDASTVTITRPNGSPVGAQAFSFTATVKTVSPGAGAPTGYLEWAVCPDGAASCTPQNGTKGGTIALPKPTAADKLNSKNRVTISIPGGLAPGYYEISTRLMRETVLSPAVPRQRTSCR